jgi:hypothetical protein
LHTFAPFPRHDVCDQQLTADPHFRVCARVRPLSSIPMPVRSEPDPSFIPCPHCGRRFNEQAAERHIPKCKSIIAKPKALSKGGGTRLGAAARERELGRNASAGSLGGLSRRSSTGSRR